MNNNKKEPIEDQYLRKTAQDIADVLGISDVSICLDPKKAEAALAGWYENGYSTCAGYVDDEKTVYLCKKYARELFVDSSLSASMMVFCLAHELRHAWQHMTGLYVVDPDEELGVKARPDLGRNILEFHGYNDQESELDANAFATAAYEAVFGLDAGKIAYVPSGQNVKKQMQEILETGEYDFSRVRDTVTEFFRQKKLDMPTETLIAEYNGYALYKSFDKAVVDDGKHSMPYEFLSAYLDHGKADDMMAGALQKVLNENAGLMDDDMLQAFAMFCAGMNYAYNNSGYLLDNALSPLRGAEETAVTIGRVPGTSGSGASHVTYIGKKPYWPERMDYAERMLEQFDVPPQIFPSAGE